MNYIKKIIGMVLIGLIVAGIGWAIREGMSTGQDTNPTWSLARPSGGEASIRPVIDSMAKPDLSAPCKNHWARRLATGQECLRVKLTPPELAAMRTQRLPFKETGPPLQLLELFIKQHAGCLELERKGEQLIIREPNASMIRREGGKLICPVQ